MRIALAGFSQGYYAVEYTRYLSRLRGVEIVSVCDLGASEAYVRECAFMSTPDFAAEVGAPLTHTLEELLAARPDAVLLCCETADHCALAARVLAAGAHVFVSKPLCFRLAQVEALRVPEGLVALCGQPLRYEQGVMELTGRLNEIGRVYSVRLRLCHEAMIHQAWERDSARSGGPLGTYGVYLFDLARAFSGAALERLYAVGGNTVTPQITACDTVKVLATGGGVQFSLELYSAVGMPLPFLQAEVIGERGVLETRYDNPATVLRAAVGEKPGALRTTDMTRGEMEHFLACLRGESAPACGVPEMRYVARCLEATYQSLQTGLPVAVKGAEGE